MSDQPTTWDGEPIYSPSTVAEGLFTPTAFEQIPGQLPMSTDPAAPRLLVHVNGALTEREARELSEFKGTSEEGDRLVMTIARAVLMRVINEVRNGDIVLIERV